MAIALRKDKEKYMFKQYVFRKNYCLIQKEDPISLAIRKEEYRIRGYNQVIYFLSVFMVIRLRSNLMGNL